MLRYMYTACLFHDSINNTWVFLTVDSVANDIYPQNSLLTQVYFWLSFYIVLILWHQSDVCSIRFDVVDVNFQMEVFYVCDAVGSNAFSRYKWQHCNNAKPHYMKQLQASLQLCSDEL